MKAILVIDEPSSCWECRFDHFHMCMATQERKNNDGNANKRPSWCPLKPMSMDSIPIKFLKDKIAENESWGCNGYAKGLQSAIDEWEKEIEK